MANVVAIRIRQNALLVPLDLILDIVVHRIHMYVHFPYLVHHSDRKARIIGSSLRSQTLAFYS